MQIFQELPNTVFQSSPWSTIVHVLILCNNSKLSQLQIFLLALSGCRTSIHSSLCFPYIVSLNPQHSYLKYLLMEKQRKWNIISNTMHLINNTNESCIFVDHHDTEKATSLGSCLKQYMLIEDKTHLAMWHNKLARKQGERQTLSAWPKPKLNLQKL